MSYRFDSTQVNAGAYHWGFRGLGVLGSEVAHGGDYDGYIYASLDLPADNDKEYWAPIVAIPAGMTGLTEYTGFDYAGTSVAFYFDLYEDGILLGRRRGSILIDGIPVPGGSTVTSVAVSPSAAAVTGFSTQQFVALVSGTGDFSEDVTWEAAAGSISVTGEFTAPAATGSIQTITITATSVEDDSVFGTATVTVPAAAAPSTGDGDWIVLYRRRGRR